MEKKHVAVELKPNFYLSVDISQAMVDLLRKNGINLWVVGEDPPESFY